jgi:tetratricopeptide (TPR) repeat protein
MRPGGDEMTMLRICLILFSCGILASVAVGQVDPSHVSADTNNAVIEGRVTLPSGVAVERKIILKNSQSTLSTLYTNKHGEFNIINLSEGVYYVHAEDPNYDPAEKRIELGRGIVWELTLQLRDKLMPPMTSYGARVVSTAELRQSVPADAKKEYNLGLKSVSKGDLVQAAAHFKEALTIYPEYLAARNDLGAQYLKLKRLDEAEADFRNVLERDPKNFNAQFNLGLVHIERRGYVEAIARLTQAIAIDSTRPVARLWLGFALLETGDLANAERELTKGLVMGGSECVAAHYHLARIYVSRGDNAQAARSLQAYLEEAPKGEYVKDAKLLQKKLEHGIK